MSLAPAAPVDLFVVPGAGGLEVDASSISFAGFEWAVPALVLTVPGILIVIAVVVQAMIGLALAAGRSPLARTTIGAAVVRVRQSALADLLARRALQLTGPIRPLVARPRVVVRIQLLLRSSPRARGSGSPAIPQRQAASHPVDQDVRGSSAGGLRMT